MLKLIISTQRTGSTSLLKTLEGTVWLPKTSMHRFELFNFSNFSKSKNTQLEIYYLLLLLEHLENNTDQDILVKVLVDQVCNTTLKTLIKHATALHHAVRLDYKSQLTSLICAQKTSSWYERSKSYSVEITQSELEQNHDYLSSLITKHSKLYHTYGGVLHILEERDHSPYLPLKIINDNKLKWPDFNTKELFF